jgi:hypothetical protein
MAHFAELDENNIVIRVIVINNEELIINGEESEEKGSDFCHKLLGGTWKQTSYNGNFRKNYAAVGYTYDVVRDAFIPPKPFDSWDLNEDTCIWEAPIPYPDDGNMYRWSEETGSWIIFV